MWAWTRYAGRPGVRRYLLVLLLFVLGLMSKPMVVTLPFVLLLLDFWPLGRFAPAVPGLAAPERSPRAAYARLLYEKAPLLLLTAASCVVTIYAQGRALAPLDHVPFAARLANALVAYTAYLVKTAWPAGLAVCYPHPGALTAAFAVKAAGSALLLVALTGFAVRQARRRPYLAVGWLWYLGTLVPVIGLVQVGGQAMADRYTYIPLPRPRTRRGAASCARCGSSRGTFPRSAARRTSSASTTASTSTGKRTRGWASRGA